MFLTVPPTKSLVFGKKITVLRALEKIPGIFGLTEVLEINFRFFVDFLKNNILIFVWKKTF